MRQIYRSIPFLILIFALSVEFTVAQKDTTKLNQEVEVVKAYRPSISNANKVNLLPVIDDTTRFVPEFKYSIESKPIKTGFTATPIDAADVNGFQSKTLGLGYLKLGVGTYNTPYGELFLNLPKSDIATFGLHLRHLSSDGRIKLREGDQVDAPFSQNSGEAFGGINIGNTVLSVNLSYNRDAMLYYGYPVAIPTNIGMAKYGVKQAYQNGGLVAALKSSEGMESNLKFDGGFRLGFFDALTGQKETSAGAFGTFDYKLESVNAILKLSFDNLTTDSITLNNNGFTGSKGESWFRAAPSVRVSGDKWSARGGIKFVGVSSNDGGNKVRMYPDLEFNYQPIENVLTLYAGLTGDLKNNSYGVIAAENHWADPKHNVLNADYQYIVFGGLKGKISRELSWNLGLKYNKVKDLYFYEMSGSDDFSSSTMPPPIVYNNNFKLNYDNGSIFNLSAEFSYLSGKDLSVILKGNYYNYKLDQLQFASNMPDFDLTASSSFKIIERLTGFADLTVIGKRQAKVSYMSVLSYHNPNAITQFSIDPTISLNMGAAYELTSKIKLFGRIDNLLNRPNEQWLGYASQGLRILAGVTVGF